ncbi:MAG: hypothetical protein JO359_08535, partial [Candidatus Eremiobacteraeota bacterium]|nr:hypothetical protein [Candidatus Eremiobacteraeota bacterium]
PLAIRRAQGIPNNGETPTYVRRVIALWHALRARVADAAHPPTSDALATALAIAPYADIISLADLARANDEPSSQTP